MTTVTYKNREPKCAEIEIPLSGPTYHRPVQMDIDTVLMMSSAAFDGLLAHKHGAALNEAHTAVREAVAAGGTHTPEPATFEPHPVLAAAGNLIRTRGWLKNSFYDQPGGAVCALAAIRETVYGRNWLHLMGDGSEMDAVCELLDRIAHHYGNRNLSVPSWNDRQDNVDAVLRLLY